MEWKDVPGWVSAVAAVVSACGVFLAYWQLKLMKRMADTQFEDNLSREYRGLAAQLPTKAMLGESLSDDELEGAMDHFFHYIDLSNEQVFLRQHKRISLRTWINWRDGIGSNLRRPAFAKAWEHIKKRSGSFAELRRLEAGDFLTDPAEWGKIPITGSSVSTSSKSPSPIPARGAGKAI